jgi:ketosteroid isomerase-like protein
VPERAEDGPSEGPEDLDATRGQVRAVLDRFYAAFESADLDAMRSVWLDDDRATCVHPGALPVRGAAAVGRSWALVMANTPYLQFILTDVDIAVAGETASVSCTENVLTAEEGGPLDSFGAGQTVSTNILVRTERGWRLWVRHSSPVVPVQVLSAGDDQDE